jgi:hypothetical protein
MDKGTDKAARHYGPMRPKGEMMINGKARMPITLAAVVLAMGLLFPGAVAAQETSSQEGPKAHEGQGSCRPVRANYIEPLESSCCTVAATITNGGILNGTMELVYNPAFAFTPDPNVVSYLFDQ